MRLASILPLMMATGVSSGTPSTASPERGEIRGERCEQVNLRKGGLEWIR